jgi:hypothetical protein
MFVSKGHEEGLWDHHAVCVIASFSLFYFLSNWPNFTKLYMKAVPLKLDPNCYIAVPYN